MASVHKDIERLIVRRLDDALTEEEQLQLDRELIRNPAARTLLEDYRRVDALATAALSDVFGEVGDSFDVSTLAPRVQSPPLTSRHHRGRWLMPGAVAAALLAMVVPSPFDRENPDQTGRPEPAKVASVPNVGAVDPNGTAPTPLHATPFPSGGLNRNVSQLPRTSGKTVRDVFGVMGEDGSIYWIEVDRSRTIRQGPKSSPLDPGDEL